METLKDCRDYVGSWSIEECIARITENVYDVTRQCIPGTYFFSENQKEYLHAFYPRIAYNIWFSNYPQYSGGNPELNKVSFLLKEHKKRNPLCFGKF